VRRQQNIAVNAVTAAPINKDRRLAYLVIYGATNARFGCGKHSGSKPKAGVVHQSSKPAAFILLQLYIFFPRRVSYSGAIGLDTASAKI